MIDLYRVYLNYCMHNALSLKLLDISIFDGDVHLSRLSIFSRAILYQRRFNEGIAMSIVNVECST